MFAFMPFSTYLPVSAAFAFHEDNQKNGKDFILTVLWLLFIAFNESQPFQATMILTSHKPQSESHE